MHQISQLHDCGLIMVWLIQLLLIGIEKGANIMFGSESYLQHVRIIITKGLYAEMKV